LALMLEHVLIQETAVQLTSWKKHNPVHFLYNGAQIIFNSLTL
jgi:hypothetical protein